MPHVPSIFHGAYAVRDEMTFETSPTPLRSARRFTIDELAAAQGVLPLVSTEEWAGDIFESDDELEAFLSDLRSNRSASNVEADPVDRFDEEAL